MMSLLHLNCTKGKKPVLKSEKNKMKNHCLNNKTD